MEEFVDSVRVKADQNLCSDNQGWGRPALVNLHQLGNRLFVRADVLFGEFDSSSLEDRPNGETGGSAGLTEEYHLLGIAHEILGLARFLQRVMGEIQEHCLWMEILRLRK